jgi:four helix bundle protein
MNEIKSYKDLLIWKKGITIVKLIYQLVKTFPQEEMYALSSQLKRASVSIPSNIAEGYGRNTDKSFSHFLDITRGSLFEIETQLIIAKELGFITNLELFQELLNQIEEESKMINAFSKTLKANY